MKTLSTLLVLTIAIGFFCPSAPAQGIEVKTETDVPYGDLDISERLVLDLALPDDNETEPRPLVVWIHGGGWKGGDKKSGLGIVENLVATGKYIGASINYRQSGTHKWPAQIHDCKAAIRWLRANAKRYRIDPERIGVFGTSAGGHLSAMMATTGGIERFEGEGGNPDQSSRVTCAAVLAGPSDFLAYKDFQRDSWGQPNSPGGAEHDLFGHPLDAEPRKVRDASPISHIDAEDPPVLVLHGELDPVVPFNQAELFDEALTKAGVDVTFVRVIRGGHTVAAVGKDRIDAFFAKHLAGDNDAEISGEPIDPGQRPPRVTPSTTAIARTEIAKLAAALTPGSWAPLDIENAELLVSEAAAGCLVDAESASWLPRSQQLLLAGGNDKGDAVLLGYTAATNRWDVLDPSPPWRDSRSFDAGAVDPGADSFYFQAEGTRDLHYLPANRQAWHTLQTLLESGPVGSGAALVYSVPMRGLIRVFAGHVQFLERGARDWVELEKNLPMGSARHVAEFVPATGLVVLGGGAGSNKLHALAPGDPATFKPLPAPPVSEVAVGPTVLTADPASGDLLLLEVKSRRLWSLAADAPQWEEIVTAGNSFLAQTRDLLAAPISDLGVVLFVRQDGAAALYKHK